VNNRECPICGVALLPANTVTVSILAASACEPETEIDRHVVCAACWARLRSAFGRQVASIGRARPDLTVTWKAEVHHD
jgi:hypothetical protein